MHTVTQTSQSPLLLTQVSAAYGDRQLFSLESWQVAPGESAIILGPSGCGKSTLLAMLTGLRKPDSGTVIYGSTDLYALSETQRDHFRGQQMGILFQSFHLVKAFTVRQNLLLALSLSGRAVDEARIEHLLSSLNLQDKAAHPAGRLSVGEAQRLAVARAVIGKPAWIFCDEPTSALDDRHTAMMLELLQQQAQECGAGLIIVTHDKRVCDFFDNTPVLHLGDAA
jgi:putative ABC transport system ATP-binding protein